MSVSASGRRIAALHSRGGGNRLLSTSSISLVETQLDEDNERVATLILNRPPVNSLSLEM